MRSEQLATYGGPIFARCGDDDIQEEWIPLIDLAADWDRD